MGPTAIDIEDKEATATTREGLDELIAKAGMNVKDLPMRQVITSFAGLRAHEDHHEFIIKELEDAPGFVDCAGIESPGLTSCPAIGRMVAGILRISWDWSQIRSLTAAAREFWTRIHLQKRSRQS